MSVTFTPLSDTQRVSIAPLANQFNVWLNSLIDTLAQVTTDAKDVKVLQTLKLAMSTVVKLKPTVPFEHFAHQCRSYISLMIDEDETFILEHVPHISYIDKMGITPAKWHVFDNSVKDEILSHVAVLGKMCRDLHDFQVKADQTAVVETTRPTSKYPQEVYDQIKAMLPPDMLAQVMSMPGGLDQLIEQSLGGGAGGAGASAGAGGADDLTGTLNGLGSLVDSLKTQFGDLPDDATAQQKNEFYTGIARWLGEQINVEGSLIYNVFGKLELAFPKGLSCKQIDKLVSQGKGLLKVMGCPKHDAAWKLVRTLTSFIDQTHTATKRSVLNRETVVDKLVTLVKLISESKGGIEGLLETAMESQVLKQIIGQLTGLPIAEVAKDPFGAFKKATSNGPPTLNMSSITSLFGGGGGSDDDEPPSLQDDDDNTQL